MKILVTGGGGFLGRYIVDELIKFGNEVSILGRRPHLDLSENGIKCLGADITDKLKLNRAFRGFDAVIHSAAKAGIWGKYEDYYNINYIGTKNVIEACKFNKIKYLVYTSTPSVVFNIKSHKGGNETLQYGKRWLCAYAETKAIAEKYLLASHGDDLKVCALRPHLIFGPGDPHLLPRVVDAVRKKRLKIIGDGRNLVDVTYVKDAAYAHRIALDLLINGKIGGSSYFISQGSPVYLWDWLNEILTKLNMPIIKSRIPLWSAYSLAFVLETIWGILKLNNEPPMTRFAAIELSKDHFFDITKAKKELNFYPQYNMKDALDETLMDLRRVISN